MFFAASHCFQPKGRQKITRPNELTALLGKHSLTTYNEIGSRNSSVSEIILHQNWQWNNKLEDTYNVDIVVVVLSEQIEFNRYILPVCLPKKSEDKIKGKGWIAGWGQSVFFEKHAAKLNELEVPIIDGYSCLLKYPDLTQISSEDSFCGGYENLGKGPCRGDSGGGFFF
jgi:hypothetical protein